jgi:hypothetical protein
MRRLLAILTVVALTLALGACGGDDETTESGDSTTTSAEAEATTTTDGDGAVDGSTTTTAGDGGIDPMEDAGTDPIHREENSGAETSLLTDVRVARHEGFDRVVFEFDGALPGYDVEYVQPPITEDGSGDEIDVAGEAFLSVTMRPASGFDLSQGEGEQTYDGPTRIAGEDSGTSVIQEVVRTGDFEAVLGWVIGISDRVDFRVDELSGPSRLVIDVRNH